MNFFLVILIFGCSVDAPLKVQEINNKSENAIDYSKALFYMTEI